MIPKSDRQRQREADRQAQPRPAIDDSIKVYRGAPFAATVAEVVPPSEFVVKPPPPPFKLSAGQRNEIFEGLRPRIAFTKDKPCPTGKGEVIDLTSQVSLVVDGIAAGKEEWELHYTVFDTRANLLGRTGGYASSSQGAIGTRKPIEQEPVSGPQFRAEVEPEAVTRSEATALSDRAHSSALTELEQHRAQLEACIESLSESTGLNARGKSEIQFAKRKMEGVLEQVAKRIKRGEAQAA